jgi:hypothetical protein
MTMPRDFIPSREADIVTWSVNFNTKITATPTAYGLTAAQASAYAAKHTTFVAAHQTARDPDTRSPAAIVGKDVAKTALVAEARKLARIVQAEPSVTPQQKAELGLTVRDVEPTPVPPPSSPPDLDLVSAVVRTVRLRLEHSGSTSRRGKPYGVAGAAVYSFVGAEPPSKLADWKFEGNTTRTVVQVLFDPEVAPGAKVWITACWFNPRMQNGPASSPLSTHIPGGAAQAA